MFCGFSFCRTHPSPPEQCLRTDSPKNLVPQYHLKESPPSLSSFPSPAASSFLWSSFLCPIDKKAKILWVHFQQTVTTLSQVTLLVIKLLNLVGVNDGSHQFMFDKQHVFAVRLALEAGFLLHGVVCTVTWRSRLLQLNNVLHKDERFEYGPVCAKEQLLKSSNCCQNEFKGRSWSEIRRCTFQGLELLWNSEPLAEPDSWVSQTPCFLLTWTCPPCWCRYLYPSGCPSSSQQWCDLQYIKWTHEWTAVEVMELSPPACQFSTVKY